MISFYPGPSRVEDKTPVYVRDAFHQGILSMNHRSPEFMALYKKTVAVLRRKLAIPNDFSILFTSSATECWEVITQSLVESQSIHFYNGAFGKKWFDYTRKLKPSSIAIEFDPEALPEAPLNAFTTGDVICLTQNETSNGTQLPPGFLKEIQKKNPHHLIAVDVTSSLAGIRLDFSCGDLWLSSVQKCFGQPAGLGIMILSPKATDRIVRVGEQLHYNSLKIMYDMMLQWQTSYTPNVLAIYSLMRTMTDRESIRSVEAVTHKRFAAWTAFFNGSDNLRLLTQNPATQSRTVLAVTADPELITKIKATARKNGFLLGEGYGPLKKSTFRIANFPALKEKEITGLRTLLKKFI